MFELEYEKFLAAQIKTASGQRLEMLKKDMVGTKRLLEAVIWPVLKSFEGVILECEMVGSTGVKIYIDVYYEPLQIAFECEGFVVHAEKITRDRFDFEKTHIRSFTISRKDFMPYSKDQLDKHPDMCKRSFLELLGQYTSTAGSRFMEELSVNEREVIRYGVRLMRPIRLQDIKYCLKCQYDLASKVIQSLLTKKMIKPIGSGSMRYHEYVVLPLAREYLLQSY